MLGKSLVVSSYVVIREGCPLAMSTEGDDHVQIVCGWPPDDAFEIVLQRQALRALLEIGADALERLDEEAHRE